MKQQLLNVFWKITRLYLLSKGAIVGENVKCNGFPHIKIKDGGVLDIGARVNINATRWSNAHIVSGSTNLYVHHSGRLAIKSNTGISGSRIVSYNSIEIGNDCMVGAGCLICDSDMHEIPLGSTEKVRVSPIKIGNGVFIGAGSTILKGVKIGDGTVIGAGSVVTKDIPSNSMAAGNPARVLRTTTPNQHI